MGGGAAGAGGASLVVQCLRLCLLTQGCRFDSQLGSYDPTQLMVKKKQNIKQKQYCNKFNKHFKNGTHPKKNLKKNPQKLVQGIWEVFLLPAWFICKSKSMLKLSLSLKKIIKDKKKNSTYFSKFKLAGGSDLGEISFPCMYYTL